MSKSKSALFILALLFVNIVHGISTSKSLSGVNTSSNSSNSNSNKSKKAYKKSASKNNSSKNNSNNSKNEKNNSKKALLKKLRMKTSDGFGFDGTCTDSFTNILTSALPANTAKLFSGIILPLVSSILSLPQICLGDFYGSEIMSNYQFSNAQCSKLPLSSDHKYGVISFAAFNVPCDTLVSVGACLVFDDEGTGAVIFNGDLVGCAVSLTGVGKVFSPFLKFLGAMGFGVSLNRKFEKTLKVCYNDNSSIECGNKTTKGHFLFVINLALPTFKIGTKDLSDYLQLNATITYMIDFGNLTSYLSLASTLFSYSTCSDLTSLVGDIKNLGAEYTLTIEGNMTLTLSKHTNGFLPDLDFELFESDIVITTGGGNSGLTTGVYFYLGTNVIESIANVFTSLFNRFSSILGFSIPSIDLSSLNAGLGVFLDSSMFGIKIFFPGIEFYCYFKFSSGKGSCKYNNTLFTAILEAAKWIIRQADVLFDEAGDILAEFGSNTTDWARDASSAVANYSTKQYKLVAREATKVATSIKNLGEQSAEEILSGLVAAGTLATSAFNTIKSETISYFSDAVGDIIGLTNEIGDTVDDIVDDVIDEAADFTSDVSGVITSGATTVVTTSKTVYKAAKKFFKGW